MGGGGGGGQSPWVEPGAPTPETPPAPAPPPVHPPVAAEPSGPSGPPWTPGPAPWHSPPWSSPPPSRPLNRGLIVAAIVGVSVLAMAIVAAAVVIVSSGDGGERTRPDETREISSGWVRPGDLDDVQLVVSGDTVCGTGGRELFCLDAPTGGQLFSEQLPAEATAPTLVGDTLVVGADGGAQHGDLYGYSLEGRQRWEATQLQVLEVDASVSVLRPTLPAAGNVVAVPTGSIFEPELVGIDARSGREVWRARGTGHSGRVLSDGRRFYIFTLTPRPVEVTADDLRNLDPADALDAEIIALLEEYASIDPADSFDYRDPEDVEFMLDAGLLPVINAELSSRTAPALVALDAASGGEVWRAPLDPAGPGSPSSQVADLVSTIALDSAVPVGDGAAVAFTLLGEPGSMVVLDAATGARLWTTPVAGNTAAVAHIEGTTIVVDGTDMRGFDAEGREVWRVPTPGGRRRDDPFPPELVVEDGTVYGFRHDLFTVDPADGTSRMVRRNAWASDVAVAGDHLVIAGLRLGAVELPN